MEAKKLVLALCAIGFLQTSFAGFERLWFFSKGSKPTANETWEALSEEEQRALIKRYQNLKEIPEDQSIALQQRMDWFNQLPEPEKQKMREAWQKMNTAERDEMRQKIQKATTANQKAEIREVYFQKYLHSNTVSK